MHTHKKQCKSYFTDTIRNFLHYKYDTVIANGSSENVGIGELNNGSYAKQ